MKIIRWLDEHLEEYILSGLLVVIAGVMMLQVIMRYAFNASLSWAEEASRYAFVWSALVSIGYSIKEGSILKVDTLVEAMPGWLRNLFTNAGNLIVTVFFGYLFIVSVPAVQKVMRTSQLSPALRIPMGWVYLAAIAGFLLATVRAAQKTGEDFIESVRKKGS
ncbi:MAG: Tripartite ATP-independent periplasmic transporter DctQ component [Synergistales bacterium 53_16]|nr:MAG: Tripartite ATP-independent periplasmic transporter DctQ component [Synergistales bacterium 53_16]HAG23221.1 TRAP transporter small permease [Synergistaceae bacterium]